MNYEFFLSKEDFRSYSLLKYLEERTTLSESIINIQEELALSNFLFKKTVDNLVADIEKWQLVDSFRLHVTNNEITLEVDGSYSSDFLLAKYIKESLSFKLIVSFFKKEHKALDYFADQHFVSYSIAYNTLRDLKKNLKKYKIYIDKNQIVGSSNHIVFFFNHLFVATDVTHKSIYSDFIIRKSSVFLAKIASRYPLSNFEWKKLFHYIALRLYVENDKGITVDSLPPLFFVTDEMKQLKKELSITSDTVFYNILAWLYINNKLDEADVSKVDMSIEKWNRRFVDQFEEKVLTLSSINLEVIYRELTKIHFNLLYFPLYRYDEITINIYFFKQNYPEFYFYLIDYVEEVAPIDDFSKEDRVFLFFNYLMLLINHVPLQLVSVPVKIAIDFSHGESYNTFIKKNLELYVNMNVKLVDSEKTNNADIVITNMNNLYEDGTCHVVVWLDPPRAVDWGNLTRVLLNIQEENYKRRS